MANASTYNIELRSKNGKLKQYLTPFASDISWEWNTIGGCGRCSMTIHKAYLDIDFEAADDIRIWIETAGVEATGEQVVYDGESVVYDTEEIWDSASYSVSAKLVYRGWLAGYTPKLEPSQSIVLDIRGYYELLERIVVNDGGDIKTYTNMMVSEIVSSVIDDYVIPNTAIDKGTIDSLGFSVDQIEFKSSVAEALKTLAELEGDVEFGVDENLIFFWRQQDPTVTYKLFVGNNIEKLERRQDFSRLANKIYFEGGKYDGTNVLITTGESTGSQTKYFLAEKIITNSSIVTSSVADRYIAATLKQDAKPALIIRVKVANTQTRYEGIIPIGKIKVSDPDYDQPVYVFGTIANGGSGLIFGVSSFGGSGAKFGGSYAGWLDRIKYTLSEESGRFNSELEFGVSTYETSKIIKRIEHQLNSLRQR